MSDRSGHYAPQPGNYKAFIPAPLPPNPPIHLDDKTSLLLSRADQALARLDGIGQAIPSIETFVSAFMKKEAVQSSQIEGTQSTLADLFNYEAGAKPSKGEADMQEITNYLAAMKYGLNRLDELPFAVRLTREIHKILMTGVRGGHRRPGEFRKTQVHIGPKGSKITEARFVPPPPDAMLDSVADLERFINSGDLIPELVKCALIHYQFEAIHPFLDGNGRLGRMLITFYLCWTGMLTQPLLYLSYFLNRNRQEYQDRLLAISDKGAFEDWIAFFLRGVLEVSEEATGKATEIVKLQRRDIDRILESGITSPSAMQLLNRLFVSPITNTAEVSKNLGVSKQTANDITAKLERMGILKETTGASRNRRYAYTEYIDLIEP